MSEMLALDEKRAIQQAVTEAVVAATAAMSDQGIPSINLTVNVGVAIGGGASVTIEKES